MSTPPRAPAVPRWLSASILALLASQVGLLWFHGTMLQRQHEDIQALREDIQYLAEDLYQDQEGADPGGGDEGASAQPVRSSGPRLARRSRARRAARIAWIQAQGGGAAATEEGDPALKEAQKDLAAVHQSGQEALGKARKVQDQLSWSVNAQKAEEAAKIQEAQDKGRTWMWAATGLAMAALMVRLKLRRRS
jgi:hypothetical protein